MITRNFGAKLSKRILFVVAIAVGLASSGPSQSQEKTIRYGVLEAGYPPYVMSTEGGRLGIIGDTFMQISKSLGYSVEPIVLPVKRVRLWEKRGELDAVADAVEWRGDLTGYVWTDGIIRVSDNVVMIGNRPAGVTVANLFGKDVAIMSGYMYPSLEQPIKSGAIRVTSVDAFSSLLGMVDKKRVDFGILDQNVAKWVIREEDLKFSQDLHFVTPGFDEVEYRVLLTSQKWAPFVQEFNEALAKFKTTDGWQEILNRYR